MIHNFFRIYKICILWIWIAPDFGESADTPYTFSPSSKHIEVNDGGFYSFGFSATDSSVNFTDCYYSSNTGFHGSHQIINSQTCEYYVYNANDSDVTSWTISVYDAASDNNFTEDVSVQFYYNIPVLIDSLYVLTGASLFNYVVSDEIKITKCSMMFYDTTVELDLNSDKIGQVDSSVTLLQRLKSYGKQKCGFKLMNSTRNDPDNFTLLAIDEKDKAYRVTTKIIILPNALSNGTLQEVYLGKEETITCGATDVPNYQKFCKLYNPDGDLVVDDLYCKFHVPMVTLQHLGYWRCEVGLEFSIEMLDLVTQVTEKALMSVEVWSKETDDIYNLGCTVRDYYSFSDQNVVLNFCRFTGPDGRIIKSEKGVLTERYSTLSTDLDNSICGLEITKPLVDEEKGTWKCEAGVTSDEVHGGFKDVEKKSSIDYKKKVTKIASLSDKSLLIKCTVPYSSEHCFILTPNGTEYRPTKPSSTTVGECIYEKSSVEPSDNGTWTCAFSRENGFPVENIAVEVSITEMKVIFADAEVAKGDDVELVCNTNGVPIEYCIFTSPEGTSYYLKKGETKNENIAYYGRGLEFGDCGVKISKVTERDNGVWTCHINPGTPDSPTKSGLKQKMMLKVPNEGITTAGSVGIGLGVAAALGIVAGIFYYRRKRQNSQPVQRLSNGSNNSQDGALGSQIHDQSNYNSTTMPTTRL